MGDNKKEKNSANPKPVETNKDYNTSDKKLGSSNELVVDIKRLAAEFDNYKKRVEKEKEQVAFRAKQEVLLEFLSLKDEFENALEHTNESDEGTAHVQGLKLLSDKMNKIFTSYGISEIKCNGPANLQLHEIIMQTHGGQEGIISEVLRKGYKFQGNVIRPAWVSVYSGKTQKEAEKEVEKMVKKAQEKEDAQETETQNK